MIGRVSMSCGPTSARAWVLGLVACVAGGGPLALRAPAALAAPCANEQLRQQSNTNPTTGKPYSAGLPGFPECRAYEMVSPPYKQSHDANSPEVGLPVAPDGETIGFKSEGAFGDAENNLGGFEVLNFYTSRRGVAGWTTYSAFPPVNLMPAPAETGLSSDFSGDLRSVQASCAAAPLGAVDGVRPRVVCARRTLGSSWVRTPFYPTPPGMTVSNANYVGASSDLTRVFFQPERPLLPYDTTFGTYAGIYEIAGAGSESPQLRLVNVEGPFESHTDLVLHKGAARQGPLIGDRRASGAQGTAYHAISESGETVFFTATPEGSERLTVYARVEGSTPEGTGGSPPGAHTVRVSEQCTSASCAAAEVDTLTPENAPYTGGSWVFSFVVNNITYTTAPVAASGATNEALESALRAATGPSGQTLPAGSVTVASGPLTSAATRLTWLSSLGPVTEFKVTQQSPEPANAKIAVARTIPGQEPCTSAECTSSAPANAIFQGASADGSKVFFTTAQQLLNSDTNAAADLYEYEFNPAGNNKLTLISGGKSEQEVKGVVRTSPDGSHVYFVENGVLTPKDKNGNGEEAGAGENLYGYDTVTHETKFAAHVGAAGMLIRGGTDVSTDKNRHAQTTPEGRYLVFTSGKLAGDLNKSTAQAVYRYDFQTGELTWISHGAPNFKVESEGEKGYEGEGKDAIVAAVPGTNDGAEADIGDWNRAVSDNGEYVIFRTTEKLQANDVNNAADVYEWHAGSPGTSGTVSMISDGRDPTGLPTEGFGMSSSGSDIFFVTHTRLVGQDTDVLADVYDARVGGGFPAPPVEVGCSGEACQGTASGAPAFGSAASSSFTAGGNLSPAAIAVAPSTSNKPSAQAQRLARALKACKKKRSRKQRARCQSQARKQYASHATKRGRRGSR